MGYVLRHVMGRDAVLPKRVFGYVHPKFKTPVFNILIVGVAMFSSLVMSLNTAMSFINFGALVAFAFVNLSVIAHYYRNRLRSFKQSIQYLLLPIIGACFILWLWMQLDRNSLILGCSWAACGIIYLLFLTKFFRIRPPEFQFDEVEGTEIPS